MLPEDEQLKRALKQPCVADTSLLSNFVHIGEASLLNRLLEQSVFLTPTVLDPYELDKSLWTQRAPLSEFLKPYYASVHGDYGHLYGSRIPHIEAFLQANGSLWKPLNLSAQELSLAHYLGSKTIKAQIKAVAPEATGRIRIDAGEAETAAVAISRGMTFLVDDRAAIILLRNLYPNIPVLQTCQLISYAARIGLITCDAAQLLFNERIVQDLNFRVTRNKGSERLELLCNPPRCEWL